jgi:hypothetical protein
MFVPLPAILAFADDFVGYAWPTFSLAMNFAFNFVFKILTIIWGSSVMLPTFGEYEVVKPRRKDAVKLLAVFLFLH